MTVTDSIHFSGRFESHSAHTQMRIDRDFKHIHKCTCIKQKKTLYVIMYELIVSPSIHIRIQYVYRGIQRSMYNVYNNCA